MSIYFSSLCPSCCDQPPSPSITLEWDSVSVSVSKCGYFNPEDDKWYRTEREDWTGTLPDGATSVARTGFFEKTVSDESGDCVVSACSGAASYTATGTRICPIEEFPYEEARERIWNASWTFVGPPDCDFIDGVETVTTCEGGTVPSGTPLFAMKAGVTKSYSDEYTDEDLEAKAEDELPAFDGDWNDTDGSYFAFTGSGDSHGGLQIRKSRWRIVHWPSPTCYLKVWLEKVFTPDGGGADVVTDLPPYVWTGTGGDPCLPNAAASVDDVTNKITASAEDLALPEDEGEGEVTVRIKKFSLLADYEPTGMEDSGLPQA